MAACGADAGAAKFQEGCYGKFKDFFVDNIAIVGGRSPLPGMFVRALFRKSRQNYFNISFNQDFKEVSLPDACKSSCCRFFWSSSPGSEPY